MRLLPARSPTLPAVDVKLTELEVSGATKLPARILLCADKEMEFEPVRAALMLKSPVEAVMLMSLAVIVAPTEELTAPAERRLNVAPAAEAPLMLVAAPVFCMNTF